MVNFKTLPKQQAKRPPVPVAIQCQEDGCGRLFSTPEAFAWADEHAPHFIDRVGDPRNPDAPIVPKFADSIRCKHDVKNEAWEATYRATRTRNHYAAGLPERRIAGPRTFQNWQAVEGAGEAFNLAHGWAMGNDPPMVVLLGPQGCGKSHLLEAAAREALDRDGVVRYMVAGDMMDDLRLRFNNTADDGRSFEAQLEYLGTVDLLVLDDLGMQAASMWALGRIVSIIDRRYRDERRTLIASNKINPEGIASWARAGVAAYDHSEADESAARLSSRLFDRQSGVVKASWIDAQDYRARKAI